LCRGYAHGSVGVMPFAPDIRTLSDAERGRPLDTWPVALQRRSGSKELPPDFCLRGHPGPHTTAVPIPPQRFRQGWEPGHGRTYECTVDWCDSVQYRY
jgi:hypothetical protein